MKIKALVVLLALGVALSASPVALADMSYAQGPTQNSPQKTRKDYMKHQKKQQKKAKKAQKKEGKKWKKQHSNGS
jgi:hypothetical protein